MSSVLARVGPETGFDTVRKEDRLPASPTPTSKGDYVGSWGCKQVRKRRFSPQEPPTEEGSEAGKPARTRSGLLDTPRRYGALDWMAASAGEKEQDSKRLD
jgi:hypothetical protein